MAPLGVAVSTLTGRAAAAAPARLNLTREQKKKKRNHLSKEHLCHIPRAF